MSCRRADRVVQTCVEELKGLVAAGMSLGQLARPNATRDASGPAPVGTTTN